MCTREQDRSGCPPFEPCATSARRASPPENSVRYVVTTPRAKSDFARPLASEHAAAGRRLPSRSRLWYKCDSMPEDNSAQSQFDEVLARWAELRAGSRHEDCSDRPSHDVTELILALLQVIQMYALPGSPQAGAAEESVKRLGSANPHLLTILPGIVKSLKQQYRQGEMRLPQTTHLVTPSDSSSVFVVHGRNDAARRAMFSFLRSLALVPIEWNQAVSYTQSAAPFVGEVLDHAYARAQAVLVLLTGDDVARLGTRYQAPSDPQFEVALTPQARPNVLFEAGMAFGRHPERTLLVTLGQIRPFSDIAGRHFITITNRAEHRQTLADRLRAIGCAVETAHRTDWLSEGDFDSATVSPDYAAEPGDQP
jgi:predicted nucleotide-binding protein